MYALDYIQAGIVLFKSSVQSRNGNIIKNGRDI